MTASLWPAPAGITALSGSAARRRASSVLPYTATSGPSPLSSSRTSSWLKSPAWMMRSAALRRSTHASGSAREPRGRWVSEMMAMSKGMSSVDVLGKLA